MKFLKQKKILVFITSIELISSFTSALGSHRSGEIVGVLKQMNDTFTGNLATARPAEAKALATSSGFKHGSDRIVLYTSSNMKKMQRKAIFFQAISSIDNGDTAKFIRRWNATCGSWLHGGAPPGTAYP